MPGTRLLAVIIIIFTSYGIGNTKGYSPPSLHNAKGWGRFEHIASLQYP